jgi:hypothetical protein
MGHESLLVVGYIQVECKNNPSGSDPTGPTRGHDSPQPDSYSNSSDRDPLEPARLARARTKIFERNLCLTRPDPSRPTRDNPCPTRPGKPRNPTHPIRPTLPV